MGTAYALVTGVDSIARALASSMSFNGPSLVHHHCRGYIDKPQRVLHFITDTSVSPQGP